MAGIYFHIPFCRQACVYCDFHFITSLKQKEKLLHALEAEILLRRGFFEAEVEIETIYFGGGTPSVLRTSEIAALLQTTSLAFPVSSQVEITLEANPDDLSSAYLTDLNRIGVNRLSIGIQGFQPGTLTWMNRSHTSQQAIQCVSDAQRAGIENISIDLILGTPGSSLDSWKKELDQALQLSVPHISVYALTVEPKTALYHQVSRQSQLLPVEEIYQEQFLLTDSMLSKAGYAHYELSNYAKPGMRSRHNSAYWEKVPYLGLGPSAHSFRPNTRSWNIANNAKYISSLAQGKLATQEEEVLDMKDRYNEYVMTGLRTAKGLDSQFILKTFGIDIETQFQQEIQAWTDQGYLVHKDHHLCLNPKGWLISDAIIRDLFQ